MVTEVPTLNFQKQILGSLSAVMGGCCLATQASLNGSLSRPLKSPTAATTFSFVVGSTCLCLVSLFSLGLKKVKTVDSDVEIYMWILPGFIGSFYVGMATFIGPRLGFSLFFVCVVLGQLLTSLTIEYFGFIDIPKAHVSKVQLFAMFIVIVGAVLAVVERLQVSGSAGLLILYVCLSIAAGSGTSIQVAITSAFTKRYGTYPHRTALLAFSVGALVSSIIWGVALIADEDIRSPNFDESTWWMYMGGILGAYYVAISVAVGPVIGLPVFFISVVAGQLVMSAMIDLFGLFESTQQNVSALRAVGLVLVFIGAVAFRLIRSKKHPKGPICSPDASQEEFEPSESNCVDDLVVINI